MVDKSRKYSAELAHLLLSIKFLAVITILATLLFGLLSRHVESDWWSGILSDLTITSLGILVTIFFIDRIVARHERRQWEGVREFALEKLRIATSRAVYQIVSKDPNWERRERYRYAFDNVRSNRLGHWAAFLNQEGWKEYVQGTVYENLNDFLPGDFDELAEVVKPWGKSVEYDYNRILQLFNNQLTPVQIELLLKSQDILRLIDIERNWEFAAVDLRINVRELLNLAIEIIESLDE